MAQNKNMKFILKKLSLYVLLVTGLISIIQISLSPLFFQEIVFSSNPKLIKYIRRKSKKFCKEGSFNGKEFQENSLFSLLCEIKEN